MVRTAPHRYLLSTRYVALATFASLFFTIGLSARAETKTVVAPAAASDADLRAAERKLLEGLSSGMNKALKGDSATLNEASEAPQPPQTQGVVASLRVNKPTGVGSPVDKPVVAPQVSRENQELLTLKNELLASKKRNTDLERQLEQLKGQLTMAETELSRMQTILDASSRARLGMGTQSAGALPRSAGSASAPTARANLTSEPPPAFEPAPKSAGEMQIATVSAEKADLRLGPGRNNSALMTVSRGSRLAVEARQGEWFRVFAPNGQRAWVHASVVTFGRGSGESAPTSVNRVRGYTSSLEDEAFQRIQSMTNR